MDISKKYTKKRADFGKQCFFANDEPELVVSVHSDKAMMVKYMVKTPMSRSTQTGGQVSWHECNTTRPDTAEHGMLHEEGGWPKEMNPQDEEQVERFRKKIQREDNYVSAMQDVCDAMEHCVLQNNSHNIYQTYFEDVVEPIKVEPMWSRIKTLYRDPQKPKRPISHLSWAPQGARYMAVTHCSMQFPEISPEQSYESYIWDMENPISPILTFCTKHAICCLEYSPREPHSLLGGLYSGQVGFFDDRKGPKPVEVSRREKGHREACHSVIWTASKSGTEFFSGAYDGQVIWWDSRKLGLPLDSMILDMTKSDVPVVSKASPCSCLEYDSSMPTKYLVGTANGQVICGNRRGTNRHERLPWTIKAHSGPIYSLQRNQAFAKNFLTVGDWSARIWSEDCKESPTMWTGHHRAMLTGGEWSPSRFSAYFITRSDGVLDLWDILQQQDKPIISEVICREALSCLRVNQDGSFIIVGNSVGSTYLVEYSQSLSTITKDEKSLLSAMFERESKREKVLDTRNREIRFKYLETTKSAGATQPDTKTNIEEEEKQQETFCHDMTEYTERYFEAVNKTLEERLLQNQSLETTEEGLVEDQEEEEEEEEEYSIDGGRRQ